MTSYLYIYINIYTIVYKTIFTLYVTFYTTKTFNLGFYYLIKHSKQKKIECKFVIKKLIIILAAQLVIQLKQSKSFQLLKTCLYTDFRKKKKKTYNSVQKFKK